MLRHKVLLGLAAVPLLGVAGLVSLLLVIFVLANWFDKTPKVFGLGEGPEQPIAFPHTIHAGTAESQAGIDCLFCHRNVSEGKAATIPAVEQCMICHKVISTGVPEFEQVRQDFLAGNAKPIQWVRVHRLPDHVRFVHEAHITFFTRQENVAPSAVCATCHGDVAAMAKVEQVRSLKMGDCVDCHRQYNAPTDCTTCHY